MGSKETEKLTMTLTKNSIQWLQTKYPDSQSTQEAVRMAISDARQHHIGMDNLAGNPNGNDLVVTTTESEER